MTQADKSLIQPVLPAALETPYSHSIINGFVKSLFGLMHVSQRLVFYRQKYRHFDWYPRARRSPSIDIYRGQSALSQRVAFEIYRDLSLPCFRRLERDETICSWSRNREDAGIKCLNVFRIKSLCQFLYRHDAAARIQRISAHPPSAPLLPSTV